MARVTLGLVVGVVVVVMGMCAVGEAGRANSGVSPFPSLAKGNVTRYTVDLDSEATGHFTKIVRDHKSELAALLAFIKKAIPAKVAPLAVKIAADLDFVFGSTIAAELRGVAAAAELPLGDIVLLNVLYELTAFCTSILAVEPDGTLLHARNLDYGLPYDLRAVTVEIDFTRSGEHVFRTTTFVGFAGVLTGMSNSTSATVDERNQGAAWENAFSALLEGGKAVTFVIRELLESGASFQDAAHELASVHLIAPSYVTIGGVGIDEAVIITRNRLSAANYSTLADVAASHTSLTWAEVVTNYDLDKPDPPSDPRRTYAEKHLEAIGPAELAPPSLVSVIGTPPVLNSGTVYSILACVESQQYVTYLR